MNKEIIAEKPEVRAVVEQGLTLLAQAERFRVTDPDAYATAAEMLMRVKAHQKRLASTKETIVRPITAGLQAVRDFFREPEIKIMAAEVALKRAMITYDDEQERLRREEQRRADEAARKERERIEAQAKKAAAAGKPDKAEALEERAAEIVPTIVQREVPKVAGISSRETWTAEVTDLRALVAGVASGAVPLAAIEPCMKFLHGQARSLKTEFAYPGARANKERGIAAGSM